MEKVKYCFEIREYRGQPFIIIKDEIGQESVTRNLKQIVEEICSEEIINPVEHNIIYRDRRGVWDGYSYSLEQLIELRETSEHAAAIKLLAINQL